jgi:hypothetical protein
MKQRHPLELPKNPSLTPYGLVTSNKKERLDYEPPEHMYSVNEERIMARLWDRVNRENAPRPLPIKTIIHDVLPKSAARHRLTEGDFIHDGLPYLTHDIVLVSNTLQWFGSNSGRCFLETDISGASESRIEPVNIWAVGPDTHGPWHIVPGKARTGAYKKYHPDLEFLIKLQTDSIFRDMDPAAFFVHECTPECRGKMFIFGGQECRYRRADASDRDRALIPAVMSWLGTPAGRAFIAAFAKKKKLAWSRMHKKRRASYATLLKMPAALAS